MADVRLTVGGRTYDVHCADGQEAHLQALAERIDASVRSVPGGTEGRQLLFAALMLADENYETLAKVQNAEPQLDAARAAAALAESREAQVREELRGAVEREQAALDYARDAIAREQAATQQLLALQQAAMDGPSPQQRPAHDRALLQIADRIEALAGRIEAGG